MVFDDFLFFLNFCLIENESQSVIHLSQELWESSSNSSTISEIISFARGCSVLKSSSKSTGVWLLPSLIVGSAPLRSNDRIDLVE